MVGNHDDNRVKLFGEKQSGLVWRKTVWFSLGRNFFLSWVGFGFKRWISRVGWIELLVPDGDGMVWCGYGSHFDH